MATKYKLSYFDAKGLAEPIRFLLAFGGVEYEDFRFTREQWPEIKPTTPFGHVPTLEIDGEVLHQSVAICRYLANKFQIAGENDWERLQCDIIVDTIGDMRGPVNKLYHEKDEEKKAELLKQLEADTIPFYMERFDKEVMENSGYFVGGKLTWADVYFISLAQYIQEMLKLDLLKGKYPNLKILHDNVMSIPGIKSWMERRPQN